MDHSVKIADSKQSRCDPLHTMVRALRKASSSARVRLYGMQSAVTACRTMDRYLHHISLTTGYIRPSERSAVSGARIELCAELLAGALAGDEPIVPGIAPQLMMHAKEEGQCLSVRLCRADAPEAPPVMTLGIAAKSTCGAKLWRSLHTHARTQLATQNEACPPEPWCAERLDEDGTIRPEPWDALQDFERCLAWAYLERPRIEARA